MNRPIHDDVNRLLTKAGRLRRAALDTSMRQYRNLMLKVARELEAKAASMEIGAERHPLGDAQV